MFCRAHNGCGSTVWNLLHTHLLVLRSFIEVAYRLLENLCIPFIILGT
jgi:hypothetical protein